MRQQCVARHREIWQWQASRPGSLASPGRPDALLGRVCTFAMRLREGSHVQERARTCGAALEASIGIEPSFVETIASRPCAGATAAMHPMSVCGGRPTHEAAGSSGQRPFATERDCHASAFWAGPQAGSERASSPTTCVGFCVVCHTQAARKCPTHAGRQQGGVLWGGMQGTDEFSGINKKKGEQQRACIHCRQEAAQRGPSSPRPGSRLGGGGGAEQARP